MLCSIQHAIIMLGMLDTLMSFCFRSRHHLAFRRPKAFSLTMRALESLLLKILWALLKSVLYGNGFIN